MAIQMRPLKTRKASLAFQTRQYLHELIEKGSYQPGQQLPPEDVLAGQLGISRPTLREALNHLELQGLIIRKHGVGTFVTPTYGQRIASGLEVLESIEHLVGRIGLEVHMGDASIEERDASPDEIAGLGCWPSKRVLSVARVILVDTQPVAYLLDVIPTEVLQQSDLGPGFHGSVLDVFIGRGEPGLAYSYTRLEAESAGDELAQKLHVLNDTALLMLEAKLFTQDDRVVDYSISHFISGYFDFHVVRRIGQ